MIHIYDIDTGHPPPPTQVEYVQEFQDVDLARFVPKEVDSTGITVAAVDRFTAKSKPTKETNGECLKLFCQ